MLRFNLIFIFCFTCLGWAGYTSCQQYAALGDLRLESGELITDCRIGYRTFGKANKDSSNLVLFPTWFGGTSADLGRIVMGADKLVDTTKYFVIAIDAMGNGISSSPSNSEDQSDLIFPRITIVDMVNSQYRLLTQKMNIRHVHAIIGGSMGGMQTFEWIVRYPDFMNKAVPYVGTPQSSSYDLTSWGSQLELIKAGLRYHIPQDSLMGLLSNYQNLLATSPANINRKITRESVAQKMASNFNRRPGTFSLFNFKCQLEAMIGHDVSLPFGGNLDQAAKRVKARVLVIVGAQDHLVSPQAAIRFAEMTGSETMVLENDCGHLSPGCEMERVSRRIAEFLDD